MRMSPQIYPVAFGATSRCSSRGQCGGELVFPDRTDRTHDMGAASRATGERAKPKRTSRDPPPRLKSPPRTPNAPTRRASGAEPARGAHETQTAPGTLARGTARRPTSRSMQRPSCGRRGPECFAAVSPRDCFSTAPELQNSQRPTPAHHKRVALPLPIVAAHAGRRARTRPQRRRLPLSG